MSQQYYRWTKSQWTTPAQRSASIRVRQVVIYNNQNVSKLFFIQPLSFGTELSKKIHFSILQILVWDRISNHPHFPLFTQIFHNLPYPLTIITHASNSVWQATSTFLNYITGQIHLSWTTTPASFLSANHLIFLRLRKNYAATLTYIHVSYVKSFTIFF